MNLPAFQFDPESARFGASRSQKRVEDARLVTGQGLFSDDRALPGEVWLVVVRSPHAHARIVSIDAAAARSSPGVVAIWSNADLKTDGVGAIPYPPLFKRADGSPMAIAPRYPLADDAVRYVGQPVVAVVAATRRQAQDAAEQVAIEYETLPCVTDARRAVEPGAPQVWPDAPGNVCAESRFGDPAAVDAALASAAHVVKVSLHNQRLAAFPLEPRAAVAAHADGRTTLYTQTQQPTGTRDLLGATFGTKPDAFRIVNGDIGGGFGMKTGLMPEDALICHAARKLGRPVRWRADRSEDFLAAHMGRDQHFDATLALDVEGRILALRTRVLGNFGAHAVGSTAMIPLMVGPKVVPSVYRVPVVDLHIRGVATNTMSTGAYRGAGRPESIYLMERLLDKAARATGLGPVEIRRRNFVPPDAMPHQTAVGEVYDSGEFAKIMDQVLARADWAGFPARKAESTRRGRLRGRGLSTYLEWTGALLTETADVRIGADGTVTVFSGTQAMGQGLETTYVQLVAEVLEIDGARIRIVQGDTDQANGVGSVGSRSAFIGGSAIVMAGHKVVDDGKDLAAHALEAAAGDVEYRAGKFRIAGTDRAIDLFELAGRQPGKHIRCSATANPSGPSWPNGAQVCEVEIDPETGVVEVVRHTTVDDVGRIINRTIVTGQIHGGIAQGVGQALYEGVVYDPESGQLLTGSLMDYGVPRADQLPAPDSDFDETIPCKTNLLGVKGCGELGTIGAVPATVHAVLDALGVEHLEMPLTAEKVWRVLQTVVTE
jgi:carbon-monoxide dehydrogenase large subunit